MHVSIAAILAYLAIVPAATSSIRKARSPIAITPNVLPLTLSPNRYPRSFPPSSAHLHKRNSPNRTIAPLEQPILTLGGRVYTTNITLSNRTYTFVLDTGSSDTWIASSVFECVSARGMLLPQDACGFGPLYEKGATEGWEGVERAFGVRYEDGEVLEGGWGREDLGIGEVGVRMRIGVVERGWWVGDGVSSGLVGLAYPALGGGADQSEREEGSLVVGLFQNSSLPQVFSLALDRPSVDDPRAGGVLAIGGIPDVPHDGEFVYVPIQPIRGGLYAWYSIEIDGFEIVAPEGKSKMPLPVGPSFSTPFRPLFQDLPPKEGLDSMKGRDSEKRSSHGQLFNRRQSIRPDTRDFSRANSTMIIDSGSTNSYIPYEIAVFIAKLFSPPARYSSLSNTYSVQCNAEAPRVGVVISGKTFWLHEKDLVYRGGLGKFGTCGLSFQNADSDGGVGMGVSGDGWLRSVVAVFDIGAGEMGFAARTEY